MSADNADRASEQGQFAARTFIARYVSETGQPPPPAFAYEMGYLRGRSDAALEAMQMIDEVDARLREEVKTTNDDDTK